MALVVASAQPSDAHRLDEYLQAVRVGIAPDRVSVELDLTPGAAVADRVITLVDLDRDDVVSVGEAERYARGVLEEVTLEIDAAVAALTLTRVEVPTLAEMREGTGTMRIQAFTLSRSSTGAHRIRLKNHHQAAISVYLANALRPEAAGITIDRQLRGATQQDFAIDYHIRRSRGTAWLWSAVALVGLVMLARARGV